MKWEKKSTTKKKKTILIYNISLKNAKNKTEIIKIVSEEIEKHFPKKDFIELKMNMETVMRHSEKHKKEVENNNVIMTSVNTTLKNIELSLIPHNLNDNKGLIKEFSDAQVEIEKLKGVINIHKVYFALLGILIVSGGLVAWLTQPLTHK
jgi:glycerol kinase